MKKALSVFILTMVCALWNPNTTYATENNDVAAFCRLAQKNGMYIIVRPGPYVCAEWEKVGEQLAPLTIQNGGPIIMIQVENEYGSYGEDKPYISDIRDCLRSIYGSELTLFQCDWSSNFEKNGLGLRPARKHLLANREGLCLTPSARHRPRLRTDHHGTRIPASCRAECSRQY